WVNGTLHATTSRLRDADSSRRQFRTAVGKLHSGRGCWNCPCTQERRIRHQERLMNKNTIAIAIAALLVGGVSVAAFQHARGPDTADAVTATAGLEGQDMVGDDAALLDNSIPDSGRVAYANVVAVEPVTETEKLYATVI